MYRIILIDDEPLILAGIASLIRWEDYDCTIIGKSTIPTEARQMILEMQPDIVITDIRMPVLNGLELVESCKNGGPFFHLLSLPIWRNSAWQRKPYLWALLTIW